MEPEDLLRRLDELPESTRLAVLGRMGEAGLATTIDAPTDELEQLLVTGGGALWSRLAAELAEEPGAEDALIGERIAGQVRIESVLGRGGMGAVYRGFDTWLERPVAVKTLRARLRLDEAAMARFRREARLLSRLDHPGICRVYGLLQHADRDFLVLELIDGTPLSDIDLESLEEGRRLRLALDIAEALIAAHGEQIVHRDLKPGNVMVTPEGRAKVLDFGISHAPDVDAPDVDAPDVDAPDVDAPDGDAVVGTLAYMSPEQARGEPLTPKSDLYAFGLLVQELFTGRPAHGRDLSSLELLARAQGAEREAADELRPPLRRLVARLSAPRPEDRPDARQAAAELRALLERPRRRRIAAVLAALLLVAAALAAGFAYRAARAPIVLDAADRLALLPIENATGDAELDWVEDGLARLVGRSLEDAVEVEIGQTSAESWPARLRRLGADVGVDLRLEEAGRGYRLHWQLHRAGEEPIERSLEGLEPTLLARELSDRLLALLRPDRRGSAAAGEDFPGEPFLDRIYAIGLERASREGPESGRPYFEILRREAPDFVPAEISLVSVLHENGDLQGAMARLEELLERPDLSARLRFSCHDSRARIASKLGEPEIVEESLQSMDELLEELDPSYEARRFEIAAEAWTRLGRSELAWSALAEAERLTDELGRPRERISLLLIEVNLHSQADRFDEAAEALEEAERLCRATDSRRQLAMVLGNRVQVLYHERRLEEAEALAREAEALFAEEGAVDGVSAMRIARAVLLDDRGLPSEAEKIYRRLMEELDGVDNDLGIIYVNMAGLMLRQGRIDEGERFLELLDGLDSWARTSHEAEDRRIRLLYEKGRYDEAWRRARDFRDRLTPAMRDSMVEIFAGYEEAALTGRRVQLPDELPAPETFPAPEAEQ